MNQKTVIISNKSGLHARPATLFVEQANQYASAIMVSKPGAEKVNAKSILGILSLGAAKGSPIEITADGPDAETAVAELAKFLETLDPEL